MTAFIPFIGTPLSVRLPSPKTFCFRQYRLATQGNQIVKACSTLEDTATSTTRGIPNVSNLFIDHGYDKEVAKQFLKYYWQRRPVFIKGGLPKARNSVTGDDLAALALDEDVTSRMIRLVKSRNHNGRKHNAQSSELKRSIEKEWEVQMGPFDEDDFCAWGDWGWTLLVNGLERYVPELALLRSKWFSFLPNCRMGDVMVSVAADGGGVGPHVDNFDVFLIQADGKRRWKVGAQALKGEDEVCVEGEEVRVLKGDWTYGGSEWLAEGGDVLYVPARYPHWGVAKGSDCVTISIGFRGMSVAEVASRYVTYVLENDERLKSRFIPDNAEAIQSIVGEQGQIPPQAIRDAFEAFKETINDRENFARWYGAAVSEPLNYHGFASHEDCSDDTEGTLFQENVRAVSNHGVNWVYTGEGNRVRLWGDGIEFEGVPRTLAKFLSSESGSLSLGSLRSQSSVDHLEETIQEMLRHRLIHITTSASVHNSPG